MCKGFFESLFKTKEIEANIAALTKSQKTLEDAQEVLNGRLDNLEVDVQSQITCQVGELFNQEREAFKLDCEKMVDQIVKSLMEIHKYDGEKKRPKRHHTTVVEEIPTEKEFIIDELKIKKLDDLKFDNFKFDDYKFEADKFDDLKFKEEDEKEKEIFDIAEDDIDDETIYGPEAECEVEEPLTFEERTRIAAKDAYARAHSPKFLGYIHNPSDLDEIPWTYYEQIRQGDFVRVAQDMWVAWTIGDDGEIGKNYECQLLAGDILVASNEFECDCATNIEDSYFQHWSILRPVHNRKSF